MGDKICNHIVPYTNMHGPASTHNFHNPTIKTTQTTTQLNGKFEA